MSLTTAHHAEVVGDGPSMKLLILSIHWRADAFDCARSVLQAIRS